MNGILRLWASWQAAVIFLDRGRSEPRKTAEREREFRESGAKRLYEVLGSLGGIAEWDKPKISGV